MKKKIIVNIKLEYEMEIDDDYIEKSLENLNEIEIWEEAMVEEFLDIRSEKLMEEYGGKILGGKLIEGSGEELEILESGYFKIIL